MDLGDLVFVVFIVLFFAFLGFISYVIVLEKDQKIAYENQEENIRDEVPYETVKQLVELTNLINYNGSSKGQLSMKEVNEYYGRGD